MHSRQINRFSCTFRAQRVAPTFVVSFCSAVSAEYANMTSAASCAVAEPRERQLFCVHSAPWPQTGTQSSTPQTSQIGYLLAEAVSSSASTARGVGRVGAVNENSKPSLPCAVLGPGACAAVQWRAVGGARLQVVGLQEHAVGAAARGAAVWVREPGPGAANSVWRAYCACY